jgi:hypothetical protein
MKTRPLLFPQHPVASSLLVALDISPLGLAFLAVGAAGMMWVENTQHRWQQTSR